MQMERITLYKKGFTPLVIRRVNFVDQTYYYEMLAHVYRNCNFPPHERWAKINMSNEQVENQIEKYSDRSA